LRSPPPLRRSARKEPAIVDDPAKGSGGSARGPAAPLVAGYRGIVADLDGVVYLRDQVIPAARAAFRRVRELGVPVAFVTNNSYRPPAEVAGKLARLGVAAADGEVFTSAQAVVHLLGGEREVAGTPLLVVGGPGLREALAAAGARLLADDRWREAKAVVAGIDTELTYGRLAAATLAIRAGARFVGSNPDLTYPTPDGAVPGAGAILALLRAASGVRPEVAGKPEPAMFETAAAYLLRQARAGGHAGGLLMVGDRSDTDLAGARRLGWDTALVLTGVTRRVDVLDLTDAPDHLLADVGGLLGPPGPPVAPAAAAQAGEVAALLRAVGLEGEHAPGRIRSTLVATAAGSGSPATAGAAAEVVGTVAWNRHGDQALLRGLAVAPGWRGRLLGTRLVLGACLRLRAAGVSRVGVWAAAAAASAPPQDAGGAGFFRSLGFRDADRGELPDPAVLLAPVAGSETPLVRELRQGPDDAQP
jgi:glycerol-1-phosphatase